MSPLDQLRARIGEHIEDVIAAFKDAARRSGIAPEDLARTDVWVVADTSSAIVRDSVRCVDPNPPRGPDALIMFAADRAQLVNRSGVIADKAQTLKVLEAPPPRGWLMVVCVSEEDGRLAEQHSLVELPAAAPSEHRDPRGSS